ncbi:uncharacterized protein LOC113798628 [Dermatophagoides pteronyssinus]|uniref:uncharacterized protein LOC113798628 n=1 Tax=Dermatophagoides pteronyssinus TaxID=6956 RepID=UPI003F678912
MENEINSTLLNDFDMVGQKLSNNSSLSSSSSSSFLIRDILANNDKHRKLNSQFMQQQQPQQRNQLFNWLLLTNQQQQQQHLPTLTDGYNQSIMRSFIDSNNNDNQQLNDHNRLLLTDPIVQQRFYQNLCYYAIQQQMVNTTTTAMDSQIGSSSSSSSSPSTNSKFQPQQKTLVKQSSSMMNGTQTKSKNMKRTNQNNKSKQSSLNIRNRIKIGKSNRIKNECTKTNAKPSLILKSIDDDNNNDNVERNDKLTSLEMIINMSNEIIQQQQQPDMNCPLKLSRSSGSNDSDQDSDMEPINCRNHNQRYRKIRRNRTVFTELQLMGLERRFDSQKYLSTPDRTDLAIALGLTQLQVKTWYQNRRMKWKKQVMQNGCPFPPTKPKGRPKKDSIPTYGLEFTKSILCPLMNAIDSESTPSSLSSSSSTSTVVVATIADALNSSSF